jgi:hypothetical protein
MKYSELKNLEISELVARYEQAASEQRRASDAKVANQKYAILAACYRELRKRGLDAQRALLPLLQSADDGVRAWIAAHATEFAPEIAEKVLSEISEKEGEVAFNARMTLKVWRENGRLSFP